MDPDDLDSGDTTSKFSDFFIFNAVIGKGAFGVVVSAISRSDNKEYAIKVIRKQNVPPKDWDRLRQEALIHVELNHKNIVGFKYIKETENRIFLVMELVKGGQLKDLIDARFKSGRGFTDEEVSLIMKSIFSAVKHFHAKEIVHRDLKPENILVQDWEDLTSIKIADFGLSTQFSIDGFVRSLRQKCGTMIYMAPELALEEKYGKPVDIWSCGLVMYIMLSSKGSHPLYVKADTPETFLEKLKSPEWAFNEYFSELAQNFFKKIMSRNPSARYTADEVEKHPWISRRFDDEIPLSAHEVMNSFSLEQSFTRIMKALYITSDFIHREVGSTLESEYKDLIDQNSEEQQRKKNIKRARLPRQSNLSDYDSLQSLLGLTTNTIASPKSHFPTSPNKEARLGLSPTKETRPSTLLTAQDSIKTQESIDRSPLGNKSNMEEAKFFKDTTPSANKKEKEEEEGLRSPDRNRFRIKSTSTTKASDILPYTDFINTNQVFNNGTLPLKSKSSLSNKSDGSTAKMQAFNSAFNGDMPDSPSTMKTEPEDENDDSLSEIKNFIGQSNTTRDRQHSSSTKVFMFKNIHTDAGFESDNVANSKKNYDDSFNGKSMRSPSLNVTKTAKFDNSNNTSYATDDSNESSNDNPRALSSKELLKFPKKSPFYHNSVKPPSPNLAPLSSGKNGKLGTFSPKAFGFPMTPSARKKHNESREFILPPITTPTQKRDGSLPRKKEEKNLSLKINTDNIRSQQNTTPMNSNSKLVTEPTDGLSLGLRSTPSISKKNFKSIQDFRAIVGFGGRDSTESLRKKGAPVIKLE